MKYYVDGYNLLFRSNRFTHEKLQNSREKLIEQLDEYAASLQIDLSIVFDSSFNLSGFERGHFYSLEVIFTSKNISADEYLVSVSRQKKNKEPLIFITSDRALASMLQKERASVISVEIFLHQLQKHSKRKQECKPLQNKKAARDRNKESLPPLSDIAAWCKIFEK